MADHPLYCVHCGAQQLKADAKFCHRCGRPIVPAQAVHRPRPPWLGPTVASAVILALAAALFIPLLVAERAGPAPATDATAPAALAAVTPAPRAATQPPVQTTPSATPTAPPTPTATPSAPTATPTPEATPTLVGVTEGPVQLSELAWSPDGRLLAVGSGTGVYVFDAATWQEMRFIPVLVSVPTSFEDAPRDLAFSHDGTMLAAEQGRAKRAIHVWRVADGGLAYTLNAGAPLAASPTEGLWATLPPFRARESDWVIQLWRTSDGQLVRTIPHRILYPAMLLFSPDGRLLVLGSRHENRPTVWQVADGRPVAQLNWPDAEFYYWVTMAFRPNTTIVAAVGSIVPQSLPFLLWDASNGSVVRELFGRFDAPAGTMISRVAYSPDGSLLAANFWYGEGKENKVQLWNPDGAVVGGWPLPGRASDISFTPDGRLLAAVHEDRVAFYDPSSGSLVRELAPAWHQGILPTPTPTPLHVGLQVPSDWLVSYNMIRFPGFRLMHPPTWSESGRSDYSVSLRKKPASTQDAPMLIEVSVSPGLPCDPASRVNVENIKKVRSQMINGGVFVTGGTWPYLIPAVFAEFEVQIESLWAEVMGIPGQSTVREIVLEWSYAADKCSSAKLTYSHELSEQDRLDVSRMLASIEFEDETHRFPTATPTFTPTPNLAPRPALPLQLTLKAQKVRTGEWVTQEGVTRQWVSGHITIEVKDAYGQPTNGARVILIVEDQEVGLGFTREGRVETTIISETLFDEAKVEVYWDQELIAQQDIAVSWQ